MISLDGTNSKQALLNVANKMLVAARTAPKARGVDNLLLAIAEKEAIEAIANKMIKMAESNIVPTFFIRDANNILSCDVMVLIGTKIKSIGLQYCGLCGYTNCEEKDKYPNHPCSMNTGDLGIAIGSAVSVAIDERVDNRIMYSVGMAVRKLEMFGKEYRIIYAIPLSCTGKNPFFDRKS